MWTGNSEEFGVLIGIFCQLAEAKGKHLFGVLLLEQFGWAYMIMCKYSHTVVV